MYTFGEWMYNALSNDHRNTAIPQDEVACSGVLQIYRKVVYFSDAILSNKVANRF